MGHTPYNIGIDVAGLVKGPVYSKEIIVRETGSITGSIEADHVEIYGHMDGKISGDNVIVGSTGTIKGDIDLSENPNLINSDPYSEGWIFLLKASDDIELDELIDANSYFELISED